MFWWLAEGAQHVEEAAIKEGRELKMYEKMRDLVHKA